MKIFIIVSLLLQLTISLCADSVGNNYLSMKKEAYALYENDETKAAVSVIKDFMSKHPKSVRAQNLLAVIYYWNGNLSKSKEVLLDILSKEKFPQAVSLLKSIEKKEGKKIEKPSVKVAQKSIQKKIVKKKIVKKKSVKKSVQKKDVQKKSVPEVSTSNLSYLASKIKKDPNDILSRKILALHYAKIGNTKQANYFANAVLRIDPDDREMLSLLTSKTSKNVSPYTSKRTVERALRKLDEMYAEKSYNRFMNLYSSLENNNVVMPTQIHVDALHCAIALEQYEKAKSILHIYRMPKTKYMAQLEELLDEKLMISRFAQDCSKGSCKVRR